MPKSLLASTSSQTTSRRRAQRTNLDRLRKCNEALFKRFVITRQTNIRWEDPHARARSKDMDIDDGPSSVPSTLRTIHDAVFGSDTFDRQKRLAHHMRSRPVSETFRRLSRMDISRRAR